GAGERDDGIRQGSNGGVSRLRCPSVKKGAAIVGYGHCLSLGKRRLGTLADALRMLVDEVSLIPAVLPPRDGVADRCRIGDCALEFFQEWIVGSPEQLDAGTLDAFEQGPERGFAIGVELRPTRGFQHDEPAWLLCCRGLARAEEAKAATIPTGAFGDLDGHLPHVLD